MPFLSRRRVSAAASVACGSAVLAVALVESLQASPAKLALFAAATVAAELLQRTHDELLPDALEGERFAVTAPIHVAAILVAGPWIAAAAAGCGLVAVGPFRGGSVRGVLARAAALAAAALAGGFVYQLAGGAVGSPRLPEDLFPTAIAGVVYVTVRAVLDTLAAHRPLLHPDFLTASAEIGLGIAFAFAAGKELWLAAALVPALVLAERLHSRVVGLRREMASALETFANIVDERDPSTHGHSLRVAGYVGDLASGLGLPPGEVSRLWWAGRLHDLGKVAVDAAVLQKPGELDDAEWAAVRRAPRLSARLLQRFRFAARQAQAVEYHRERYDGSGYYGASPDDVPLAAHFLIVADSFDAMTRDRPFRRRLSHEEALREIERGSGTQFHPAIARAFVAVRRGLDPMQALAPEELASLRDASLPTQVQLPGRGGLRGRPELLALGGGVALLVGLGTNILGLSVFGAALGLAGLKLWRGRRVRVRRIGEALADALSEPADRARLFGRLVDAIEPAWTIDYAGLVAWRDDGNGGSIELERGDGPPEPILVSWLLREAESGEEVVLDLGGELPAGKVSLALPLRRENASLVGFLVLAGSEQPPPHLLPALEGCLDHLGRVFAEAPAAVVLRGRRPEVLRSEPCRRRQARSLEA